MIRTLAALLAVLCAISCASHPKTAPPPIPAIHRIVLVPATDPRGFTFENAAPPLGYPGQYWVNKSDSRYKASLFNAAVDPKKLILAEIITKAVAQRLQEHGFEVLILQDVSRPPDDPDNVDEDHLAATADGDAVAHVWIDEVGMYSGHLSTKYLPRVNLRGKLWTKWSEDSLYSDEVDYGVDARKGKAWAIGPDERFRWGSFDELMSSLAQVRTAITTGTQLAALKIADQISAAAASPTGMH